MAEVHHEADCAQAVGPEADYIHEKAVGPEAEYVRVLLVAGPEKRHIHIDLAAALKGEYMHFVLADLKAGYIHSVPAAVLAVECIVRSWRMVSLLNQNEKEVVAEVAMSHRMEPLPRWHCLSYCPRGLLSNV
jgi:hypothetical protein